MKESASHSHHQPALDWLRGLAALAVVMFHYFYKGPKEGWVQENQHPILETVASYGYLGVHLFFMISGYVIMMTAQNSSLRRFVASRVARLIPAFWICMTLTVIIELLVPSSPFKPASWAQYVANLTMLPKAFGQEPIDGAYWSLAVEINFYAWIALIIAVGQLKRIETFLVLWLGLSLVNFLRPMYPVEVFTSAHWAPLFSAGAFFFLVRHSGWTPLRRFGMFAALVLACLYAWRETGPVADVAQLMRFGKGPHHLIVQGIMVLYFLLFAAVTMGWIRMENSKWGDLSGRLTYPLYLVHQNAGYAVLGVMTATGVAASGGMTLVSIGVIALALLVAWLVNVHVEQRWSPKVRRWIAG
ncbi:acyltransferase [Hydrogenophaga sp. 2FB]|uniref:acyltransferase family protein n=1 Tax=Hydrogenophaga sp. 2FB TaxID=2502187 RepID=UPI0010F6FCD3|nr:acyltransferase [Hydrogenophaga sp. 2FB]